MPRVQSLTDPKDVTNQYRNANNLNARIRLHEECSVNPQGWYAWLFERFALSAACRVLELGCGTAAVWQANLAHIPAGVELLLSDFSAGMVEQAQGNLGSDERFHFQVIDAQSIPLPDGQFDVVIANHMLYHVPDRARALREMRRVLKPQGRFFASTVGDAHLRELSDLITRFDPRLSGWGSIPTGSFSLENGAAQLSEYFAQVTLRRYADALHVSDAGLLTAYILSGFMDLEEDRQAELARFVRAEMETQGGKIIITKDSGLFEASGFTPPSK